MPLRPGERFGRYELSELLGRGGMGEVYSAYDTILHRKVALKVLTPPLSAFPGTDNPPSSSGGGRILREARAAAGIAHPNAVAIYDVGEVDGLPFLAMELVPGRTLRAFIGDASVPLGRRIRWITDVARALGAAHQLGLVHRDVKPENVMVRDDGLVKVLDFGIARRAIGKQDEPVPPNLDDLAVLGKFAVTNGTLTAEGLIVGTPMYMAPEQMRGEALDGRTDQFAWGVLAYEVLTGKLPWQGDGASMLAQVLVADPAPLASVNREVPAPVDTVICKALSKAPSARFTTMEAVADELEPFASVVGTTGRRERVSISVRDMELAVTEQIAISSDDVARQSGAAALSQGQTRAQAAPKGGRSAIALTVGAIALLLGGWSTIRGLSATRATHPAAPDAASSEDVPSQMSSNPDATAAYRAGLQALRDGSMSAAIKQFGHAIELDSLFGAAHLRLASINLLKADVQSISAADLQGAHASQASLGTHDKVLLDAFEHIARAPPDLTEAARILKRASQKYPSDGELPFLLAAVLDSAGKPAEALDALNASLVRDQTFAFAWRTKAAVLLELGDVPGATVAFDQCLRVSPSSTTCLADEGRLQANDGKCEALVATSRRLISLMPNSPAPYEYLLQGLLGSDEPMDAVRAAVQQFLDRAPPSSRPSIEAKIEGSLAIVVGDFAGAERAYQTCDRLEASRRDDATTFEIAYARALIALEIGRPEYARQLADAYLRQRVGLSGTGLDLSVRLEAAELAGGQIARPKFAELRDQWLARNPDVEPVSRWLYAYALPATTREDAETALGAKPDVHPLENRLFLVPALAEPIGRMYWLAGRSDEGVDYLRTASASCALMDGKEVVFSTWAGLELGGALEQRGDTQGACGAYKRVLARWGHATPRSKTAAKALERTRALRCAP